MNLSKIMDDYSCAAKLTYYLVKLLPVKLESKKIFYFFEGILLLQNTEVIYFNFLEGILFL